MPEGDTVHQAAARLHAALSGRTLTGSDFRVPQHATADLTGAEVLATVARGKHLLTRFRHRGEAVTLHTHLKMEGVWRVHRRGERWRRPAHTARVVLTAGEVEAVGFSLGVVELLATEREPSVVGHLGPDLLGPDWDEPEAVRRLLTAPERPLRVALLDQTNLAGVGNVYAAELCFVAGLHPETPVGEVPDLTRLVRRARQMLELNRELTQRVTTGDRREPLWVYGRVGRPCRRCGTPVARGLSGDVPGEERVSYWCPSCQPEARRT